MISDFPITDNQNIVVNVDTFVRETDWLSGMTAAQVGRQNPGTRRRTWTKEPANRMSRCSARDRREPDRSGIRQGTRVDL